MTSFSVSRSFSLAMVLGGILMWGMPVAQATVCTLLPVSGQQQPVRGMTREVLQVLLPAEPRLPVLPRFQAPMQEGPNHIERFQPVGRPARMASTQVEGVGLEGVPAGRRRSLSSRVGLAHDAEPLPSEESVRGMNPPEPVLEKETAGQNLGEILGQPVTAGDPETPPAFVQYLQPGSGGASTP